MKYFKDELDEEHKKYYSINFLMAEFEEIPTLGEDTRIINNHIKCKVYQTADYKCRKYYKNISSIIRPKTVQK